MDLLGSILGTMTGPPKASAAEMEKRKKEKEMAKKLEEKQREATKTFRLKVEKKINDFVLDKDGTGLMRLQLPPMSIVERQVVHDVAEIAGLIAHSFGEEGIDRHVELWKKEATPCEDELTALRQGRAWDPVLAAREKEERLQRQRQEEEEGESKRKKKSEFVPKSNYQEKYSHLIGTEADLSTVRKTEMNKSYGMVSAESKKDKRSVEAIQADIRAKKKMKLTDGSHSSGSNSNENSNF